MTAPPSREIVWVDRSGRVIGQVRSAGDVAAPVLSPDGTRVAFSARVNEAQDLWIRDLQQGTESRVTFEPTEKGRPTWFPSGRRIAYLETGGGINTLRLVARGTDGGSDRQELGTGMTPRISPDGRHLILHIDERGSNHVRYSTFGADGKLSAPAPVFKSSPEPNVNGSTLSPNGKFMAYVERQASGNSEVSVTRFPSGEGRWQISAGGGRAPVWAANGELFFLAGSTDGAKQMMATPMKFGDTLNPGTPVKLFDLPDELDANYQLPMFDVTADGKRLLMLRRTAAAAPSMRWVLVQNWQSGIRDQVSGIRR